MYYGKIKYYDVANGLGIRTSLFVSGCRNHCKGCFQPETWDFRYGKEFTDFEKNNILNSFNSTDPIVNGLSILGGEPFEPENVKVLLPLVREFKERFKDKDLWVWTGYILDDIYVNGKDNMEFLSYIDYLIDGPFILEKKDLSLKFRGSSNQRLLNKKDIEQIIIMKRLFLMSSSIDWQIKISRGES